MNELKIQNGQGITLIPDPSPRRDEETACPPLSPEGPAQFAGFGRGAGGEGEAAR